MLDVFAFHALGILCILGIVFAVSFAAKAMKGLDVGKILRIFISGCFCFALGYATSFLIEKKMNFMLSDAIANNTSVTARMYILSIFLFSLALFFALGLKCIFRTRLHLTGTACVAFTLTALLTLQPIGYLWVKLLGSLFAAAG